MSSFTPLTKGQPDWHDKYNQDLAALYNRMEQFAAENEALRVEMSQKATMEQWERRPNDDIVVAPYLSRTSCFRVVSPFGQVLFNIFLDKETDVVGGDILFRLPPELVPGYYGTFTVMLVGGAGEFHGMTPLRVEGGTIMLPAVIPAGVRSVRGQFMYQI